jgi:hypothetical protein
MMPEHPTHRVLCQDLEITVGEAHDNRFAALGQRQRHIDVGFVLNDSP